MLDKSNLVFEAPVRTAVPAACPVGPPWSACARLQHHCLLSRPVVSPLPLFSGRWRAGAKRNGSLQRLQTSRACLPSSSCDPWRLASRPRWTGDLGRSRPKVALLLRVRPAQVPHSSDEELRRVPAESTTASAYCIIHFRPRWRSRRRSGARPRANKRVGGFKASQPTWCGSWPFVSVGMKGDLAHTNQSNAASPSGTTGHLR
jgi:hypothetical protein